MPATSGNPTLWSRIVMGVFGTVSFALGAVAVFTTDNALGAAALTIVGGAAVLLLWSRWHRDHTRTSVQLRAEAGDRFWEAEQSEERGRLEEAHRLRAEAKAMMTAAAPTKPGAVQRARRARSLEGTIRTMRKVAAKESMDRTKVVSWLYSDNDRQRVSALAVMEVRADLRDTEAVFAAVENPRNSVEQRQALMVLAAGRDELDDLDAAARDRLRAVFDSVGPRLELDVEQRRTVDEMRELLSRDDPPDTVR